MRGAQRERLVEGVVGEQVEQRREGLLAHDGGLRIDPHPLLAHDPAVDLDLTALDADYYASSPHKWLMAPKGTGLLITSMIGSTISQTTGDYSRGAAGFWVENGKLAYPVQECTIAGNLRDMLLRIIPANDARAHLSTRVPSCLIDGLTLAGA